MDDAAIEFLDSLIAVLWANRIERRGTHAGVTLEEINWLCRRAQDIFCAEMNVLELTAPITICGDIHAQFHDLLRIFDVAGPPSRTKFLFLGDYVDRGFQGVDTLCLLFAYKIRYPDHIYLLRGNHECTYISQQYGFAAECSRSYPKEKVWELFCDTFNFMPIAAIVGSQIFCVHGGISPNLTSLADIAILQRPQDVPDEGLFCDLLWADPDPEVEQWTENERGTSYCFGRPQAEEFLRAFEFSMIVRAHQAVDDGYEFPFGEEVPVVTVFSAPNYCYEYGNQAAIMQVDANLHHTFKQFQWEEAPVIESPDSGVEVPIPQPAQDDFEVRKIELPLSESDDEDGEEDRETLEAGSGDVPAAEPGDVVDDPDKAEDSA
jgi:serine/threonine-protein phosphatase PP1 catalytic subunit